MIYLVQQTGGLKLKALTIQQAMSHSHFPSPNPSSGYNNYSFPPYHPDCSIFNLSDYLISDDVSEEDSVSPLNDFYQNPDFLAAESFDDMNQNEGSTCLSSCIENGESKLKLEVGFRVAFKTKSELEIMDDGFKWRKYGKKTVKNSPNPRNYYRCSTAGCSVKKRVERDRDDPSYVITTYEGVHNHESPSPAAVNHTPHNSFGVGSSDQVPSSMAPHPWTLQATYSSTS